MSAALQAGDHLASVDAARPFRLAQKDGLSRLSGEPHRVKRDRVGRFPPGVQGDDVVTQIGSHGCLFVPAEKSAVFVLPRGEYFRPVLVGDHPLHGLQRLDADVLRHGHFVLEHVVPLVAQRGDALLERRELHVGTHGLARGGDELLLGVEQTEPVEEAGLLYPEKKFIPASRKAVCPNMKLTTLEKCVATLSDEWDDVLEHEVTVPEHIRVKALQAVERMIAY